MKKLLPFPSLLAALLSPLLFLTACQSPIQNAYELRKRAARSIATGEGLPTVWNVAAPLELGRVYQCSRTQEAGRFLSPGSNVFVGRTRELKDSKPKGATWSETRSGTWNVKPQLTWMGLRGQLDAKNIRAITFSINGDSYEGISDMNRFEDILNLPTYGPALRQRILEDTERLEREGLPSSEAKYWVVIQLISAKDLSVIFDMTQTLSGTAETVDPAKLAGWLQVAELSPASLTVTDEQIRKATFTSPDVMGLVAQCVPLKARASGPQRGKVYLDLDTVLLAANTPGKP